MRKGRATRQRVQPQKWEAIHGETVPPVFHPRVLPCPTLCSVLVYRSAGSPGVDLPLHTFVSALFCVCLCHYLCFSIFFSFYVFCLPARPSVYMPSFLRDYLSACLPACLPAFLPACPLACLPVCMSSRLCASLLLSQQNACPWPICLQAKSRQATRYLAFAK